LKLLLNYKRIIVTGLDVSSVPKPQQTVSQTSLWQLGKVVVTVFDASGQPQSAPAAPVDSDNASDSATDATKTISFCTQVKLHIVASAATSQLPTATADVHVHCIH
jgi:hypothetical protein